eukprot:10233_1
MKSATSSPWQCSGVRWVTRISSTSTAEFVTRTSIPQPATWLHSVKGTLACRGTNCRGYAQQWGRTHASRLETKSVWGAWIRANVPPASAERSRCVPSKWGPIMPWTSVAVLPVPRGWPHVGRVHNDGGSAICHHNSQGVSYAVCWPSHVRWGDIVRPAPPLQGNDGNSCSYSGTWGLGQMGVKIAKAMGCVITVVSRSVSKQKFATDCGASSFVCSEDAAQMKAAAKSFDLVLNTIPAHHDYQTYTNLVAKGGKHIILGLNAGLVGGVVLNSIPINPRWGRGEGLRPP